MCIDVLAYARIEIVVDFLDVKLFSYLILASYGAGAMTWEFGEILSCFSSTFLYHQRPKLKQYTLVF